MKPALKISLWATGGISLAVAAAGWRMGQAAWSLAFVSGALWGLVNAWTLSRLLSAFLEKRRGFQTISWIALKFAGLYGLLFYLLVGLRLSAFGWLAGFTVSLAALSFASFGFIRSLRAVSLIPFLFSGAAASFASSQEAQGAAHPPEIPNFITLMTHFGKGPFFEFLGTWENAIFAFLIVLLVGGGFAFVCRNLSLLPSRAQIALEAIVSGLDDLVCGVLGKKEGRRYLPFVGSLFLFILSMNLAGLVPGLKSPTSRFEMTGALAFCVFIMVQATGIKRMGMIGYLDHMIGQPRDAVGWILSPLMLFIHGIGEIVKPISLALRLFGNIMGEDTLLGVFVALGALTMAWSHLPIGVPLHLPFVLLAIIFSVVQALVFTMLSVIYIYMMLPHEEAHENGV